MVQYIYFKKNEEWVWKNKQFLIDNGQWGVSTSHKCGAEPQCAKSTTDITSASRIPRSQAEN